MTMTFNSEPVACTLPANARRARVSLIADINSRALLDYRQEGKALYLRYAPEAYAELREIIRLESQCCKFMGFNLQADDKELGLQITAPDAETLSAMVGQFTAVSIGGPQTQKGSMWSGKRAALATAAGGAICVAGCAAVPVVFPTLAVALAGTGGVLGWVNLPGMSIKIIALLAIVAGWAWLALQVIRQSKKPSKLALAGMSAATASFGLAVSSLGPTLISYLRM